MSTASNAPVTSTRSGEVRGSLAGGMMTYLGLPYAAPPKRFELPQPRSPWKGVLEAVEPGPAYPHRVREVPQIDAIPLIGSGSDGGDGDYLHANIWAPETAANAPTIEATWPNVSAPLSISRETSSESWNTGLNSGVSTVGS